MYDSNLRPTLARLASSLFASLLLALGATSSWATTYRVGIGDDCDVGYSCFTPSQLNITVGDSVQFYQYADTLFTGAHNVVADDGSFRCATGCDGEGGDGTPVSDSICDGMGSCTFNPIRFRLGFTRTFNAPGIVVYHDEISHASGVIVVQGVEQAAVPVVSYYNWDLDVTFYTADPQEIAMLGTRVGYTGWALNNYLGTFLAWASAATAPTKAVPVCRFYWPELTLHFFTAFAAECDALINAGSPWLLETSSAFYVLLPDATTGSCEEGSLPVYRLFANNDHYFATSFARRAEVLAATPQMQSEGYGPLGVAFCTPQR
jgi:plastocyanin